MFLPLISEMKNNVLALSQIQRLFVAATAVDAVVAIATAAVALFVVHFYIELKSIRARTLVLNKSNRD